MTDAYRRSHEAPDFQLQLLLTYQENARFTRNPLCSATPAAPVAWPSLATQGSEN